MIVAYLNDLELPPIGVPLTETTIENATDVVTADNNVFTTFAVSSNKRGWNINLNDLSDTLYNAVKAIYDSQWTTYEYPLLSIPFFGISNVPVRMSMSPKEVFNNCGSVQNVVITLRESSQLNSWSS